MTFAVAIGLVFCYFFRKCRCCWDYRVLLLCVFVSFVYVCAFVFWHFQRVFFLSRADFSFSLCVSRITNAQLYKLYPIWVFYAELIRQSKPNSVQFHTQKDEPVYFVSQCFQSFVCIVSFLFLVAKHYSRCSCCSHTRTHWTKIYFYVMRSATR